MTYEMTMAGPEPLAMRLERARLRLHFARVDARLSGAGVLAGLCASTRQRSLAQLRAYAREGRFPLHGGRGPRRPVFIDHTGTHCAMGHLLAINGHAPLARRIARENNYAYIPALAATPGLAEAVHALGLTTDEAALIQPGYDDGGSISVDAGGPDFGLLLVPMVMVVMAGGILLGLALLASERVRQTLLYRGFSRAFLTFLFVFAGVVLGCLMLINRPFS